MNREKIKQLYIGQTVVRVDSTQDHIVISFEKSHKNTFKFVYIGKKKYAVNNGAVAIPFSSGVYETLFKKGFRLEIKIANKTYRFVVSPENIVFEPYHVIINNQNYYVAQNHLVEVSSTSVADDSIIMMINRVSLDTKMDLEAIVIDNSNATVWKRIPVANDVLTICGANEVPIKGLDVFFTLCETDQLCMTVGTDQEIKVDNRKAICISHTDEKMRITPKLAGDYRIKEKTKAISFPDSREESRFIEQVLFEASSSAFHIYMRENSQRTYNSMELYLNNVKTEKRELIFSEGKAKEYFVDDLIHMIDFPINKTDRYIIEYEIKSKSDKVLERQCFAIKHDRREFMDDQVLMSGDRNHIRITHDNYLIVENKSNHFFYSEKYEYDFSKCTFKVDYDVISFSDSKLSLSLNIISLISEIKWIDLFIDDVYTNNSYTIASEELARPSVYYSGVVEVDLSAFGCDYYDLHLPINVKITYKDDSFETSRLFEKQFQHMNGKQCIAKCNFTVDKTGEPMVKVLYVDLNDFGLKMCCISNEEYRQLFVQEVSSV